MMKKILAIAFMVMIIVTPLILNIQAFACFAEETYEEYVESYLEMRYEFNGEKYYNGYSGEQYFNSKLEEKGKDFEMEIRYSQNLENSRRFFEFFRGGYSVSTSTVLVKHDGCYWVAQSELDRLVDIVCSRW